jgi:hypothetical protein
VRRFSLSRGFVLGVWVLVACGRIPEPEPMRPWLQEGGDEGIVFGTNSVYKLGDGEAVGSSCQEPLNAAPISGSYFEFGFEVLQTVAVSTQVEEMCGIDYANNIFALKKESQIIASKFLGSGATESLPSLTLQPGQYKMIIEAGGQPNVQGNFDIDDFFVGKLRLLANRNVRQGSVSFETRPPREKSLRLGESLDVKLGDGQGDAYSCSTTQSLETASDYYDFRFRVPTSGANVQVAALDACGVDYSGAEIGIFTDAGVEVLRTSFGSPLGIILPAVNLAAGDYRLRVRSARNPTNDLDDLLIRHIDLKSNVDLQAL